MTDPRIIEELVVGPTAEEESVAAWWCDSEVGNVGDLAQKIAGFRAAAYRAGMERAAKAMCTSCSSGIPRSEDIHDEPMNELLTDYRYCDAANIWSLLAAHDAALAEMEKQNG